MLLSSLLLVVSLAFEVGLGGASASGLQAGGAVPIVGNATGRNPGLITFLPHNSIALVNARLYEQAGLQFNQLDLGLSRLSLGARFAVLGSKVGQEFTGSVVKGVKLGPDLGLGLGLACYGLHVAGEYTDWAPGLTAGGAGRWGPVTVGAAVRNFNRPALECGDLLPVQVLLGAAFRPVSNLLVACDVGYEEEIRAWLGTQYDIASVLSLSVGIGLNPLSYAGGIRLAWRALEANYAYHFSPRLKETHVIGLGLAP